MLVIPLGPEDREVRRWPWVTIAIVALNVLVFVLAGPSERSAGDPQGLAARWGFIPGEPSPWTASLRPSSTRTSGTSPAT
jgi:hypothetical protein